MAVWNRILGPRVPREEYEAHRERYRRPVVLFGGAALLLVVSILLPYWHLRLTAPQFPDGRNIHAYVNRLEGDVPELEGLNHYVGMQSFESGAVFERSVAVVAILTVAGLLIAAWAIHSRWVVPLVLPALMFPAFFIGDLQYWLWRYGHELDPLAPFANAVGEFTPPVFGPAHIAQFDTLALPGAGLVLALLASGLVAAGLLYHRRAYKPLIEKLKASADRSSHRLVLLPLAVGLLIGSAGPATGQVELEDLQGLIDRTPAGSVLHLDEGLYQGGVTIDKPLTVRGVGFPVIDAAGVGTAIEITAPDVTIEGLLIRNTGDSLDRENAGLSVNAPRATIVGNRLENVLFGVFLREAHDSVVADNSIGAKNVDVARRGDGIRLWESHGSTVENNTVVGGRDSVMWFSDDLTVRGNEVSGGRYGLHFMYSDDAVIEDNLLNRNSVGGFLMYSKRLTLTDNSFIANYGPSGYGIGFKDMDGVVASGNRFVANRVGIYLDNSPWSYNVRQTFTDNLIAHNDIGVLFLPSVKRNDFSGNAFVENREQVGVAGSGRFGGNEWTISGLGNYWSDFAGYDADGDGVGDIEYRLDELYGSLTDRHPELTFFAETPAARAASLAGRLFPILEPEAKVVDTAPLVNRPTIDLSIATTDDVSYWLVAMSVGLLAGAALIVVGAARSKP